MADRSHAPDGVPPDDAPDDDAAELELFDGETDEASDEEPKKTDRSLTNRWWWQGAVAAATGVVVIVWQWDVIGKSEAIVANWIMVGVGAIAVVAGGVLLKHDRPAAPSSDDSTH